MAKDILLITPPFTQLNTPYPATVYLKGFLNTKQISSFQMDLGIEVIAALFSKSSLENLFNVALENNSITSQNSQRIYALKNSYLSTINPVISFLQGKNETLARQICTTSYLPKASRFDQLDDLEWAFGSMGIQDKAKHLATLYLEDLSDFIKECVDENFGFSRYAERLGQSANSFDELYNNLQLEKTYIDTITLEILDKKLNTIQPKLVCISVPFPGNLFSGFRCAQFIKKNYPEITVSMGGGFPNTELRSLSDVRVFEFLDFITLDDGELPIEILWNFVKNPSEKDYNFKRTFLKENNKVVYNNLVTKSDYKQSELGTPDYTDLLLDTYLSVIEIANPMHSLWSDGRWNKLTMAHGCYWAKCTFCDISLDYIKIYEPITAKLLVDRMETIIETTGESGFHFVDEAAPPALMRALALEILKRDLTVTWWANIRFEKSFTKDLCALLKASGLIAVSGGLEVASDRLLRLIDKGVTVEQVAQVNLNFTESDVLVHAYLMYGFPTQTEQETVDSLEMVRQLFRLGIINSGFWHQFSLTAHSPIGLHPKDYGVLPNYKKITFANNDVEFKDVTGIDHSKFSYGLKKSIFNFMHGIGFDVDLQEWFDFKIPSTTIHPYFIEDCLTSEESLTTKMSAKIVWLGGTPLVSYTSKTKRGKTRELIQLAFHTKNELFETSLEKDKGEWLLNTIEKIAIQKGNSLTFQQLKADFELYFNDFELFWYSKPIKYLRNYGLLVL
ncbi:MULTISPECIES: B12-binding domain-containing radical SAM protein [Flavobacteriaceae]|uniref:Radical SAM protein n=2 Tax=Flavobacteriaceae TaxID=49546 RepID=A0A4Y8ATC3_9FLAO|nr:MULTISPECIES: radical SAM protein [Flavobacteriaceae]TEW73922.1 radical SAM protein [Gramella jeungdoensis]GGK38775.1 radical SAM protein [Lutibacter litoralis]